MRIGLASPLVRLYLTGDDQEQDIAERIVRFQRRNFRYINRQRCLVYRLPDDEDALKDALKAFLGHKRGQFMFTSVMEQLGEAN